MSQTKKEIRRFLIVGFSAVATDMAVYYLLKGIFAYSLAKAVSFIGGTFISYLFNKHWTFGQQEKSNSEIVRFILVYLFSLCVNVLVNKIVLSLTGQQVLVAFLCATATSAALNFLGQKWWVFKARGASCNCQS